jgi:hypothetical protein
MDGYLHLPAYPDVRPALTARSDAIGTDLTGLLGFVHRGI